jgi:hypothetical protein
MKSGDSPTVKEHSMFNEQRTRLALQRTLVALVLVTSAGVVLSGLACAGGEGPNAATGSETAPEATTPGDTGDATPASGAAPGEISADDYDQSLFDDTSTTIDNEWWPLAPGTRFEWRGWTEEEEGQRVPHRIVFTVTDLTKVIDGVRTVVGWDRDFSRGELVEGELIFLAQDKNGNVWHFGQYSETYEDGEFVGGSTWLVGHLKGAKAGILMKADPRPGTPPYSQGFAPPPFYWDDWGKVSKVGQDTCVPAGCFNDVLVIDEFEPTKPGAHQLKYYARGVGNVRTGWRGADADREVLVLKKIVRLGPDAVARARTEAFELETRASVYGGTPPAEPRREAGS